jgi:hypothetical protein
VIAAELNDLNGSIQLKTRISASITVQKAAGGFDEKFATGSAERPVLPPVALAYALP